MSSTLLQFPQPAYKTPHSRDGLARVAQPHFGPAADSQARATRIAEQVEREVARQARRHDLGLRIELTSAANLRTLPRPVRTALPSPGEAAHTLFTALRTLLASIRHSALVYFAR